MTLHYCSVSREGPLTLVTLERPALRNALHTPAHFELADVFDDFAADDAQWVAIVTGAGKGFCAGDDLKFRAAGGVRQRPASGFAGLTARTGLDKPVIAAVNGDCMGGGFELALACDVIVGARSARFGLPEPRVGLAALSGGIQRLARDIGYHRAMALVLTGRPVDADEGLRLGFVNEVVGNAEEVLPAARRWAAAILECGPLAIRASKQAALRGLDEPTLALALERQRSYPASLAMLQSEDHLEGPRAFAQKRRPRWQAR